MKIFLNGITKEMETRKGKFKDEDQYLYYDVSHYNTCSFQFSDIGYGSVLGDMKITFEGTAQYVDEKGDKIKQEDAVYEDVTDLLFGVDEITENGIYIESGGALSGLSIIRLKLEANSNGRDYNIASILST
jgi:hypothetical protein